MKQKKFGVPQQQKITLPKKKVEALYLLYRDRRYAECEKKCAELLSEFPTLLQILSLYGGAISAQSRHDEAIAVFEKAIKLDAKFASAYLNKGLCHFHLEQYVLAIQCFDRVLELTPKEPTALYTKGIALNDMMLFADAADVLEEVVASDSKNVNALNAYAYALENIGELDEAVRYYELALALNNNHFEVLANLGRVNSVLGNKDKAIEFYKQSLAINPNNARAHRAYSRLVKYKSDDPYIVVMEELYRNKKLQDKGHVQLCFALSKVYEDLKDYEKSFQLLKEGNDLHKKTMNYNVLGEIQLIQNIMQVFKNSPPQLFPDEFPGDQIQPVFILGMPRSGTSLVEQIVSSHSQVYGAGELGTVRALTHELVFSKKVARVFLPDERKVFHDKFLGHLQSLNRPEKIIIDKMPHNFMYIGYILSAFPNAKIIHLNRDPVAVCWSMYQRFFPAQGLNFCYDLDDLATFQRLHDNIMRFWNELYPGKIYEIDYQQLTENQEEETRKLLAYCDLPWEDACLEFYNNEREVRTASLGQVRNKMYTGSSEAWRKFEQQLRPLIKALNYT